METNAGSKIIKLSDTHFLVESRTRKGTMYHVVQHQGKKGVYYTCGCPRGIFKKSCFHIDTIVTDLGGGVTAPLSAESPERRRYTADCQPSASRRAV
jgi:hypothetical protein